MRNLNIFLVFIVILSAFLILPNLDNSYLWLDEAETALLAKNILKYGIPIAFDGKNIISQEAGREYDKNYIWYWTPWLQFYVAAFSFLILGVSTFSARIPFALFGIASIILIYYTVKYLSKSERAGRIAGILLVFCVPFLLYVRQCRYYSLLVFFTLLSIYTYLRVRDNSHHKSSLIFFIAATTFLFHSNYLLALILMGIILLHWCIFDTKKIDYRKMAGAYGTFAALNAYWCIKFYQHALPVLRETRQLYFLKNLGNILSMIDWFIFPILILAIFAILLLVRIKKLKPQLLSEHFLLLEIIFGVPIILALVLPHFTFFRYLLGLIPIIIALIAIFIDNIFEIRRPLGVLLAVILCFFNIKYLSVGVVQNELMGPIPVVNYMRKLAHENRGPIKGLVAYFSSETAMNEKSIAITHGDLPLKFYTEAKIFGGATGEDLRGAENADYIIMRNDKLKNKTEEVREYLLQNASFKNYERIKLDYSDYIFEDCPEPYYHRFATPLGPKIVIYKKQP